MKKKSSRKMYRTATALTAKAENIMTYTLEGLIHEKEPLFVALYLSPAEEAVDTFKRYPDNEDVRYIVSEVYIYHKDLDLLAKATTAGFFDYEVNYLLKIAKQNRIAAARFIPIFCTALAHADELCLSAQLREDLKQHIEYQKELDGFAIISTANQKFVLYFAKDVIPA